MIFFQLPEGPSHCMCGCLECAADKDLYHHRGDEQRTTNKKKRTSEHSPKVSGQKCVATGPRRPGWFYDAIQVGPNLPFFLPFFLPFAQEFWSLPIPALSQDIQYPVLSPAVLFSLWFWLIFLNVNPESFGLPRFTRRVRVTRHDSQSAAGKLLSMLMSLFS